MKRPNILIITSDQQRKDSLHCYNQDVITPELDKLAEDGTVYDRAYITHPTCTPSRASILSGQFASRHGAYTIGTRLPKNCSSFAQILSENGYETYFVGKPHFQQLSTPGSFEYYETALQEELWQGEEQKPYYGFSHYKIYNGHTKYSFTAGMHYRLWLKEKGLTEEEINNRFDYKPSDYFREHGEWKIERKYHPSVFTSEEAVNYLDDMNGEKPFAMWVSFSDPHDPHTVPAPYDTMYDPEKVQYKPYIDGEHDRRPECYNQLYYKGEKGLPFNDAFGVPSAPSAALFGDDQYFREITAVHHGMVKLIDEETGKIIQKLKDIGEYNNTLIIFTTDHGDYLGNHGFLYKGFPAFEEVYNVPLIVKAPGKNDGGNHSQALVSHVDIAPTILDIAGVVVPVDMQGISQKDTFSGKHVSERNEVLIENRPVQNGFYQKMIVTEQWKLVVYMDSEDGELYNLENDPDQYVNLWNKYEYASVKEHLLRKICDFYQQNGFEVERENILHMIWKQMHLEEPVQVRSSYS